MSRKLPREQQRKDKEEPSEQDHGAKQRYKKQKDDSSASSTVQPPPPYGSRAYWEQRYRKVGDSSGSTGTDTGSTCPPPAQEDAYHSWYFSYEELRPLILPLLFGSKRADDILQQDESTVRTEHDDSASKTKYAEKDDDHESPSSTAVAAASSQKEKEHESVSSNDDDDDDTSNSFSNSSSTDEADVLFRETGLILDCGDKNENTSIEILELGCGDVPLGVSLAQTEEQFVTNYRMTITCVDYSSTVIQHMKQLHPPTSSCKQQHNLVFQVADARKLPYDDESFHFILEKGTLDAMLSDVDRGVQNSIQCIRESARVLKHKGVLLIVSHLNAHTPKGLAWLEDVVFEGLKDQQQRRDVSFSIEVHASNSEPSEEDDDDSSSENAGPAVYIIHKQQRMDQDSTSTIPVRFLVY